MLTIKEQSNYLAQLVQLKSVKEIEGANTIQLTSVNYTDVVIGKNTNVGDYMIYFPVECEINKLLLSYCNLFRDSTLNVNPEEKGFFEVNGRVRCMKMMGGKVKSEGFMIPRAQFDGWLTEMGYAFTLFPHVNTYFDTVDAELMVCEKYVPKSSKRESNGNNVQKEKTSKLRDLLIDRMFEFYGDTGHLKQNTHKFSPSDIVVITNKLHGSSAIFSHTIINKKLKWHEKLLKRFGVNIPTTEYGYIISSGKPKSKLPKNIISDNVNWKSGTGNFYSEDIWGTEFQKIKDVLPKGITLYGEIVGPSIQGPWTYGVPQGQTKFYCYRITMTSPDGVVHAYDWHSLKKFCERNGIDYVPEFWVGTITNYLGLDVAGSGITDFGSELVEGLSRQYLEKKTVCGNPDEGICIQSLHDKEWFKLKSFSFLEKESKILDTATEVNE